MIVAERRRRPARTCALALALGRANGRAVSADLSPGGAQLGGVEAEGDDRVGALGFEFSNRLVDLGARVEQIAARVLTSRLLREALAVTRQGRVGGDGLDRRGLGRNGVGGRVVGFGWRVPCQWRWMGFNFYLGRWDGGAWIKVWMSSR